MKNMWMVRSHGGELISLFLEKGVVALGWHAAGSFAGLSKTEIKKSLEKEFTENLRSIPAWTGMIENFVRSIDVGDYVLTYDPEARVYYVGEVTSDYFFDPALGKNYANLRRVKWRSSSISRDLLSAKARHSLGSLSTVFKVSADAQKEILCVLDGKDTAVVTSEEIKEEVQLQSLELSENSTEILKDAISGLSPDEMEELLKEILNAMGYVARRSPKGADRGIDVFASKDGLGLEEPRIFAEVKHHSGKMDAQTIRTFLGGRQDGDKCLFLSTGGFTKDARYEAERSKIPLSLIDMDLLAELVRLHYDNFRSEGKLLLPLKKVYIPVTQGE